MCKKKRKASSELGAGDDNIEMEYHAKTESLKASTKPREVCYNEHYSKPPLTGVKPTKAMKENEEFTDDMYESV